MIGYLVGLIGLWVALDGLYSITLYMNSRSHDGDKQDWKHDHWVRAVRIALGIVLIAIGKMLLGLEIFYE